MGDPEQFLAERRLLFAIAYRMLGSAADADDVLQDAFLRWAEYGKPVDSPRSFLTTMVVRLCLDQLGSARARRVDYVGPWLPADARISLTRLNSQPGAVITESGRVTTAIVLDILHHQVTGVRIIVNPDKLSRLQTSLR